MTAETSVFIHPLADVQTTQIGNGTKVWQYIVALPGARIGADCNVCSHCFIENDVVVGDRVTIKNGVQLWDGLRVGDDVFIGPNAMFANEKLPRSRLDFEHPGETVIEDVVSIGAVTTNTLPAIHISHRAKAGAGAVVTSSLPSKSTLVWNRARIGGYSASPSPPTALAATNWGDSESRPLAAVEDQV